MTTTLNADEFNASSFDRFADADLDDIIAFTATLIDANAMLNTETSTTLDIEIAIAAALRAATRNNDANLLLAAFDLCPMHEQDMAICSDDNLEECAQLRAELT
jgi:hypothetical protein